MARLVVVGAGLGGLAVAIRSQAAGHQVTLIERREHVGGRAYVLRDSGYTFDMGPTIITAPELLEALWETAGRNLHDDVQLVPMHPCYDLRFRGGGELAYWSDPAAMVQEITNLAPGDVAGYHRFMRDTALVYQRAFDDLGRKSFDSLLGFAKLVPELMRLGGYMSVYRYVSRYFKDERLRAAFSFHPLFIGGSPFRASALFSIIPYLEQRGGVWFAKGGTSSLVSAMADLFSDLGGEIQCGDGVEQILVQDGRAAGVRLQSERSIPADAVVSNADAANTYLQLVPSSHRRHFTDSKVRGLHYSMSCFLLFLGTDRQYPELRHHTIVMPRDYRSAVNAIFSGHLLEDDLALYLHVPSRTDASLAPDGGEAMYALVPVPNLKGDLDWAEASDRLRNAAIRILRDELGMTDIERHIVVEHRFTPLDFRDQLSSHLGAAFSLEPTLLQAGYFRPHNRSEDLPGLYLVGAGTHPGAGIPGVLMSAEITAGLLASDLPLAPAGPKVQMVHR